ncbi:hypothetical protein ABW20_dc0106065 [Dactylellina cionopaga]|nr:hypothetical protein ABW20_dc0106065 [Dactylellina cionopaga]
MSEYRGPNTADFILGLPFLRAAFTVMDYSNKQTLIAQRRYSYDYSPTVVGAGNATVTALGMERNGSHTPAASTISRPLTQRPTVSGSESTVSASGGAGSEVTQAAGGPPIDGSGSSKSSKTNIGAIAGGVVGGVVLLSAIGGFWLYRRRALKKVEPESQLGGIEVIATVGGVDDGGIGGIGKGLD